MTKVLFYFLKYSLVILLSASALAFNPWMNTDIFEFPKLLFLIALNCILTICTILDIAISKEKNPAKKFSPEIWLLILLILGNILAYIFSIDQKTSLLGSPDRFQGFLTNTNYILLGLNVFHFFKKYPEEKTDNIFKWLIAILILSCSLAVLPYIFPLTFPFYYFTPGFFYNRVFGTFGNPNYLAAFIITLLPFLILTFRTNNLPKKLLYFLLADLTIFTLFLTGSRSAWLASLCAFLFLGIIKVIKEKQYRILIISVAITLTLVSGVIVKTLSSSIPRNYYESHNQIERLSLKSNNLTSIKTRFYLWKAGLQTYLERPLTGYGQDALKNQMEPYLPYYLQANEEFYVDRTHNEFIDILLTQGPLSLIGYLGLIILTLIKSLKLFFKKNQTGLYHIAALTGFISLNIFHFFNFSSISSNVLIYFLAGYLITFSQPSPPSP